jgi:hypothetical protein
MLTPSLPVTNSWIYAATGAILVYRCEEVVKMLCVKCE